MTFGEYLKQLRTKKGMNLRKLAELVNIAPAYLSDIEKGKRNSPSPDKMDKIAEILELTEDEMHMMQDLAADDRPNCVAPDISEYVSNNENVRVALRKARELKISNQEWIKIIEEIEKSKERK